MILSESVVLSCVILLSIEQFIFISLLQCVCVCVGGGMLLQVSAASVSMCYSLSAEQSTLSCLCKTICSHIAKAYAL